MQRNAEVVVALPNEETNQMVVFISAFGHGGQTRPRLGKMNISTMNQMILLIKDCFYTTVETFKTSKDAHIVDCFRTTFETSVSCSDCPRNIIEFGNL